jgi:phosphatidylglycerol:prolipoprotein diacylglycerol transferase
MLPTFDLGPWQVNTYGAMIGLAALVMGMYAFHRLRRQLGLPTGVIIRGGAPIFLGGLVGGIVAYYVPRLPHLIRTGTLGEGEGPSIVWGVVGAASVAVISCWWYKVPLGRAFDLGGLGCPLGQAIARLGCLAAGCCAGLAADDSWLGVYLPDARGVWTVRYPTQLMHSAANLLIFLGLLAVERYGLRRSPVGKPAGSRIWPFDGFLFLLFIALYFLQRFVIAFFREEPAPMLGPFSAMHLQAVIGMAVATTLILWNLYRSAARRKAAVRVQQPDQPAH